jgi:hypothetical protein
MRAEDLVSSLGVMRRPEFSQSWIMNSDLTALGQFSRVNGKINGANTSNNEKSLF